MPTILKLILFSATFPLLSIAKPCCDPENDSLDVTTFSCGPSNHKIYFDGCPDGLEWRRREDIDLTRFGGIVVDGRIIPEGQTCSHQEIIVFCIACLKQECIQQCCPPSQVRKEDVLWSPPRCSHQDSHHWEAPRICAPGTTGLSGRFEYDGETYPTTENSDPSGNFQCRPRDPSFVYRLTDTRYVYQTISINEKNWLNASHPDPTDEGGRVIHNYSPSDFCFVYIEEKTENGSKALEPSFMYCAEEAPVTFEGEEYISIIHPTTLLISSLFLLMTLVAYLVDPDLHRPLFGKITLCFVFNILIAFISLSVIYLRKSHLIEIIPVPSATCETLGYITLYTFLSFMFWINAMAANIFLKFSALMSSHSDNDSFKFFFYALYAQGTPFLLCLFAFLMDRFGPCDIILPNMGMAQCFLGSPWSESYEMSDNSTWSYEEIITNSSLQSYDEEYSFGKNESVPDPSFGSVMATIKWKAFFKSPEFLYFHSILIVLQVANVLFFLATVYYLVDHWRHAASMVQRENKGNFLIVLKLFFIMGIQWFGEFVSQAITHSLGTDKSFEYTLVLDLPNLFMGVLVFLVLVCKKKTVARVSSRIFRNTSQISRSSTINTRTSVIRSDRESCRENLLSKETIEMCRMAAQHQTDLRPPNNYQ